MSNTTLTVTVTADDIAAPPCFPRTRTCPVARAIQRELMPGMFAAVCSHHTRIGYVDDHGAEETVLSLTMPAKAASWIDRFDAGECVEPITFEL